MILASFWVYLKMSGPLGHAAMILCPILMIAVGILNATDHPWRRRAVPLLITLPMILAITDSVMFYYDEQLAAIRHQVDSGQLDFIEQWIAMLIGTTTTLLVAAAAWGGKQLTKGNNSQQPPHSQ